VEPPVRACKNLATDICGIKGPAPCPLPLISDVLFEWALKTK